MQNFTRGATTRGINPLNQVSPKKGPEKWLNKDRIWNLVFWFGMSAGLAVSNFVRLDLKMLQLGSWINWSTLVCIPLLLVIFNRTSFIKKDTFFNSEGRKLTVKQMPYSFPLAIILGIGVTFIVLQTISSKQYGNIYEAFILWFSMFSGISLYFILKNCPIAILFNYKFWTFDAYLGREGAGGSFDSSSNNAYYSRVRNNSIFSSRPESIWINHRKR